MSKQASKFQEKVMSAAYRGKQIFKPLNTGWIDEHVACIREYVANIFFYRKGTTTLMIDAGYNYERLAEKMNWLDIDPSSIEHILITHQDTDHVGAIEVDSDQLFQSAKIYVGREENRYLTGEVRRKVYFGLYTLPQVTIQNEKFLLDAGQIFEIEDIRIESIPVPGHTWGQLAYLVDNEYLFTADSLWLGPTGGKSFIGALSEDNKLAVRSLGQLESLLRERDLHPKIITGHTGWTDNLDFAFAHTDEVVNAFVKQKPRDGSAPYDAYDESDDTEEAARVNLLAPVDTSRFLRGSAAQPTRKKLHIEKNSVQETLVIPLYGRKLAGDFYPGLIGDSKASELIDAIDYDFSSIPSSGLAAEYGALTGALRSFDLVSEIKSYLETHPKAAVINMGCGLDTLFTQADNGLARGYNLDLPNVIEVREQLLPSSERETNIACDLNDTSWFERIDFDPAKGAIFVAAGVFYYFTNEQVKSLICAMAEAFPGGRVAFDATRKIGLKMMLATYVKEAGIKDVGAYFHVEDTQELKAWSPKIARTEERRYAGGYHAWDKRWGAFNHALAGFGDLSKLTKIIGIDFAGGAQTT